ncbi:oxidoreductase domain-containing protein [Caballeronia arvi]|uniref:Oxidoreductase domain-containing protein n=1 Tax=Caballeronia arvi TaxID=1777135 RepID=A0A158JTL9_9BURK|nr:Gfo/Idh/MocA family oxidoreductase [Caballeronia arvi]SAL71771.1 oxidoreductase domain-containing protein [Caballeronia arvi]
MELDVPVGTAVVGCGRVSDAHIGAIKSQPSAGTLVAVVDQNLDLARATAERYGAKHAFSSIEEALRVPEIEAFDLCLPNHLHGTASIQCLNAGRHVLVEKPMADDYETAVAMGAAADAAGKILAIGQSRRHGSAIRYVQDHMSEFGTLRAIQASFCMYWDGPQAPWWAERTPEEGLVFSLLGSHTIDFVQMVLGPNPIRVHAEAARLRDCWKAEDEALILLRYPENKMATVHLSYNQQPFFERYYLLFDKSIVEVRDVNTVLVNDEVVFRPVEGATLLVANELFKNQFAEFAAACRGLPNRSALHPHGIALMRVIDAALESSLKNQTVNLNW